MNLVKVKKNAAGVTGGASYRETEQSGRTMHDRSGYRFIGTAHSMAKVLIKG